MTDAHLDPQARFMDRISRRVKFLQSLQAVGLAVYLPAEDNQRNQAIDKLVRDSMRPKEINFLSPETLRSARRLVADQLEGMQSLLPHDVQYRNRIKRIW